MIVAFIILYFLCGLFAAGICFPMLQEQAGCYKKNTYKIDLITSWLLILFGYASIIAVVITIGKLHPDLKKIKWRLI